MGHLSGAVLRTVYSLHERTGHWPTPIAIANELHVDFATARDELLELRRRRTLRMRVRQGQRVWMPWSES